MKPKLKRFLNLGLTFGISGICLYYFVAGADWSEVWDAVKSAHWAWMIPPSLAIWASMVGRAVRWRILLLDLKPIGIYRLYNMQMIGIMATGLIPGRIGEFIKPLFLSRREDVSFFGTMATVVVERILDLALVVALTIAMLLVFPFPEGKTVSLPGLDEPTEVSVLLKNVGLGFGILCGAMSIFVAILVYAPRFALGLTDRIVGTPARGLAGWCLSRVKRLRARGREHRASRPRRVRWWIGLTRLALKLTPLVLGLLDRFQSGLSVFRRPGRAAAAVFWTVPIWAGIILSKYFLFFSFDIEADLVGACLLTMALALAVAIPNAPGFIGVFHVATALILETCFGVDPSVSKAYAIVLWFVEMAFLIGMGFISLTLEGLSFAEVRTAEQQHSSDAGSDDRPGESAVSQT
jgi:uncharacterized membrane protein YbhN (UPF0104 family)